MSQGRVDGSGECDGWLAGGVAAKQGIGEEDGTVLAEVAAERRAWVPPALDAGQGARAGRDTKCPGNLAGSLGSEADQELVLAGDGGDDLHSIQPSGQVLARPARSSRSPRRDRGHPAPDDPQPQPETHGGYPTPDDPRDAPRPLRPPA